MTRITKLKKMIENIAKEKNWKVKYMFGTMGYCLN